MSPRVSRAATAYEQYARSVQDKRFFARDVLGLDLWERQEEILLSPFRNRDTAVPSCHASGKTHVAAPVALAWVSLFPPSESAACIITSSDWRQVETQIFPEIHRAIARSKWDFGKDINQVEVRIPGGNYIKGISTNNPIAFHGFHADHILLIRDEFSGISAEIVESMQGMRAGGHVAVVDLMNPVMASGPSVDRCEDTEHVNVIRIDGLETPNMAGFHIYESAEPNESDPDKEHNILFMTPEQLDLRREPRPYLITKQYIRETYERETKKHGSLKPESDWWPKVRGMFPTAGDSELIRRDWIQRAHTWQGTLPADADDVVGLDVAGPGEDETAACHRRGIKIVREMAWADEDPMPKVLVFVGPPRPNLTINIDRQGIGWGMYAELRRLGYQVNGLNAGDRAWDRSQYDDAKGEMYWGLRARFRDNEIAGPIDPATRHQLAQIRWDQDNEKRLIHIESKNEARKRGVRSPDRAEALVLAFAAAPMRQDPQQWRYPNSAQNKPKRGHKWVEARNAARRRAGLIA